MAKDVLYLQTCKSFIELVTDRMLLFYGDSLVISEHKTVIGKLKKYLIR